VEKRRQAGAHSKRFAPGLPTVNELAPAFGVRRVGGSRAVFDLAARNGWRLLTSRYVLGEVAKNLVKLPPVALTNWPILLPKLTIVRDIWTMDRPAVFAPAKDRPVLFIAAAWAKTLLTLDSGDFGALMETGFYHLEVMKPGAFLERERAAGRLK